MDRVNPEKKTVPAVDGFITWQSGTPYLVGSKCKSCGTYEFPRLTRCSNPNCKGGEIEEVLLSKKGTLWSYIVEHYAPPMPFRAPDPFVPYGVGLVELPEGIRVVGMLTDCDVDNLKIGMTMEMKVEKIYEDEQGNDVVTWKFKPVSD